VPLLADSGPLLRLCEGGMDGRIGVAASTVRTTIRRFQAAGLSWPLPDELTDVPAERTTMRQVREVLRLKFVGGVPTREIARLRLSSRWMLAQSGST
jgi:hypothetical protein